MVTLRVSCNRDWSGAPCAFWSDRRERKNGARLARNHARPDPAKRGIALYPIKKFR